MKRLSAMNEPASGDVLGARFARLATAVTAKLSADSAHRSAA
jgi:hypothetical protein